MTAMVLFSRGNKTVHMVNKFRNNILSSVSVCVCSTLGCPQARYPSVHVCMPGGKKKRERPLQQGSTEPTQPVDTTLFIRPPSTRGLCIPEGLLSER